ncbi:hypothetical protein D3C72_2149250 [compost metagenome]
MGAAPVGQRVAAEVEPGAAGLGDEPGPYPPLRGDGREPGKAEARHQRHWQASQHLVRRRTMRDQTDAAPRLGQQLVQHHPARAGGGYGQGLDGVQPGIQHGGIGTQPEAYQPLRRG